MKALITLLLLFVASSCFAQKEYLYLFNNEGKLVNTRDSTDFIREVFEPDSGTTLYNVVEFYKSGKRKLAGKSLSFYPMKFDGIVLSFFENGKRKAINNYRSGEFVSAQYEYFPNGKLYTMKKYDDKLSFLEAGRFLFVSDKEKEYLLVTNLDSLGTVQVADGNGYFKGYDLSFSQINEEGTIKDGKRVGEWKGVDGKIKFTETYKGGKLVSGKSINETGNEKSYIGREMLPAFPGGNEAFSRFLAKYIRYPAGDRESNTQGKVVVSFDVDEIGKIENIRIIRAPSAAMAAESTRVLKLCPDWVPAKKFGRDVAFKSYTLPISFTLSEEITRPFFH
jgi:TonB family protein